MFHVEHSPRYGESSAQPERDSRRAAGLLTCDTDLETTGWMASGPTLPGAKLHNHGVIGLGAASAEERDSSSSAAPPGDRGASGLLGRDSAGAPGEAKGYTIVNKAGKVTHVRTVMAKPRHWDRTTHVSKVKPLTDAEVRRLVKSAKVAEARQSTPMAGARVAWGMAGHTELPVPKHPADRTRGVVRWVQKVLGRAVGLKQLRPVIARLREILEERARRAARRVGR